MNKLISFTFSFIRGHSRKYYVDIVVKCKSKQESVVVDGSYLKVSTKVAPIDGLANADVIRILS